MFGLTTTNSLPNVNLAVNLSFKIAYQFRLRKKIHVIVKILQMMTMKTMNYRTLGTKKAKKKDGSKRKSRVAVSLI